MHDHVTDGMLQFDRKGLSPRSLRLHLDNSHDARTRGWDLDALDQLHHKLHAEEVYRLAEIEAAANDLRARIERAQTEPQPMTNTEAAHLVRDLAPAVAESIVCRALYLEDGDGTVYLAEEVDPRHMPAPGPLYRLTPSRRRSVDLLESIKSSLAATAAVLGRAHQSDGAHQSDSSAEVDARPAGRPTSAGAPRHGGTPMKRPRLLPRLRPIGRSHTEAQRFRRPEARDDLPALKRKHEYPCCAATRDAYGRLCIGDCGTDCLRRAARRAS